MRTNSAIWRLTLLSLFLMSWFLQNAGAQQPAKATEPDPMKVLRQMCDYLKSLKQFSFRSEVADDQVYYGGKKLQYGIDMETFVRRPDRIRVDAEGDVVNKQFFFDGKTITLYDKTAQVYAAMDVPPDIEGALDKAHKDFGLRVALTDLASPVLWEFISKKVQHSLYVGLHKVRGIPCHHVAFDGADAHLQLWVDAGEKPLLRKVVFTQKKLEGSPQWSAYLSDWNVSPSLEDGLFNFVVPPGVKKVKFVPVKQPLTPGKTAGGKP
jgi:hypothetical protein